MFELDDEDEEATGSRPSSSHSKRGDRSSGAIRRAKFSSSQIQAESDDEGEEKQSPLSRKDLNFQGRSDEVSDANDPESVSDLTDADFSDDDSYQPSLLSDDSASDDDDELDWKPDPMTVNICFNGVDGDMKRQYLTEVTEVRKRFVKQVSLQFQYIVSS